MANSSEEPEYFAAVSAYENYEFFEIPLEEDKTISLAQLNAHFYNFGQVTGLTYRISKNNPKRVVRIDTSGKFLLPPKPSERWNDFNYICSFKIPVPDHEKRKSGDAAEGSSSHSQASNSPICEFQSLTLCGSAQQELEDLLKVWMSGKSVASCWKFKIDMATGSPLHESPIPYQDNQGTFDYICENLNCRGQTGRPSFLAIHGTPGLGKSALLERFSSLVAFWTSHPNQDRPLMLRKASNWLQNAIIISITFNHKSHVKPIEIAQNYSIEKAFIARILWSFYFNHKGINSLEFENFLTSLTNRLGSVHINDVLHFIQSYYCKQIGGKTPRPIILIVDEFCKIRDLKEFSTSNNLNSSFTGEDINIGSVFLTYLCDSVLGDRELSSPNKMIISSLDSFILNKAATGSGRKIFWIPLQALNQLQSKKALSCLFPNWPSTTLIPCVRSANGHPRSLELYVNAVKDLNMNKNFYFDSNSFIRLTKEASKHAPSQEINDQLIAFGILGDSIELDAEFAGSKFIEYVANGIYVHSYESTSFVPHLAGFLLFNLITNLNSTPKDFIFRQCLEQLGQYVIMKKDEDGSPAGHSFEKFHFYFECVKHISRKICKNTFLDGRDWKVTDSGITCSLFQHYHLFERSKSELLLSENIKWLVAFRNQTFQASSSLSADKTIDLKQPVCWSVIDKLPLVSQFEDVLDAVKQATPGFFKMDYSFHGFDAVIIGTSHDSIWCYLLEMKFITKLIPNSSLKQQIVNKLVTQFQSHHVSALHKAAKHRTCYVISVFPAWHILPLDLLDFDIWKASNATSIPAVNDVMDAVLVLGRNQLEQFYCSLSPYAEFALLGPNSLESEFLPHRNRSRS